MRFVLVTFLAIMLTSCASTTKEVEVQSQMSTRELAQKGIQLSKAGQYTVARQYFSRALKNDPKNCHLHFLNALSYQLEGKGSNYRFLDLAAAGYETTIKFCPQDPWAYYYLGLIYYQKKEYSAAELNLAKALKLGKGKSKIPFFKAYVLSAQKNNDHENIEVMIKQLEYLSPKSPVLKEIKVIARRMPQDQFIQEKIAMDTSDPKFGSKPARHRKQNKQVFVDAVIILSRETDEKSRGVNLLNGLQLQYGITSTTNRFGTSNWPQYADALNKYPVLGTPLIPDLNYSSLVTKALSLTTINYNLNIFNDFSEHDQILSRPTLLAREGKTAEYFSGSDLLIGVAGINIGEVQIIPVGLRMTVTPTFLKDGSLDLDVNIGREFLTEGQSSTVGTFETAARTIKENTHTSVNIRYGETVILSALSEDFNSATGNKTPGIGDLPLLRYAFNRKSKKRQNTSMLVLLTPQYYSSFKNPEYAPDNYSNDIRRYIAKYVNPVSSLPVLLKHLAKNDIYSTNKVFNSDFYNKVFVNWAMDENYSSIDEF